MRRTRLGLPCAAYLRRWIRADGPLEVKGFHFALTQATGFDTGHQPEIIFVSPHLETSPGRPGALSAPRGDRAYA